MFIDKWTKSGRGCNPITKEEIVRGCNPSPQKVFNPTRKRGIPTNQTKEEEDTKERATLADLEDDATNTDAAIAALEHAAEIVWNSLCEIALASVQRLEPLCEIVLGAQQNSFRFYPP